MGCRLHGFDVYRLCVVSVASCNVGLLYEEYFVLLCCNLYFPLSMLP